MWETQNRIPWGMWGEKGRKEQRKWESKECFVFLSPALSLLPLKISLHVFLIIQTAIKWREKFSWVDLVVEKIWVKESNWERGVGRRDGKERTAYWSKKKCNRRGRDRGGTEEEGGTSARPGVDNYLSMTGPREGEKRRSYGRGDPKVLCRHSKRTEGERTEEWREGRDGIKS